MKLRTLIGLSAMLLLTPGFAQASLDVYLDNLNISAHADLGDFQAQLGARFGLSRGQVEVVLSNVDNPADAALVLWLGEQSRQPREKVLQVYQAEKSHGWGAMAKSLGIKPGSAEFHALKNGEVDFHPEGHSHGKHDHGKQDKSEKKHNNKKN